MSKSKNENYYEWITEFIDEYISSYGIAPTIKAIAQELAVSPATVSRYLRYMDENNMIDYKGYRRISTPFSSRLQKDRVLVGVLGEIACGLPSYAEENIERYVELPSELTGSGSFFMLRAYGDSMVGAGIESGDMVLVRCQEEAEYGDIVVAMIDGETTLKTYRPDKKKKKIILHPENPEMEDIEVPYCEIQGVAVKVIKNLEGKKRGREEN